MSKKPPFFTILTQWDKDGIANSLKKYFDDLDKAIEYADSINGDDKDATVYDTKTSEELYFYYKE